MNPARTFGSAVVSGKIDQSSTQAVSATTSVSQSPAININFHRATSPSHIAFDIAYKYN